MPVIAVVNRKGGSGKSTLATNIAGYCANAGLRVMLGDLDRQQSTQTWLRRRAAQALPRSQPIVGWAVDAKSVLRPPTGISHAVIDTPGGMRGFELARVAVWADAILMPVCHSAFDRESAIECYEEMMTLPRVASGRCRVAAVGMRLDMRTKATAVLALWAMNHKIPFVGALREAQAYVQCADTGLTLFDLPVSKVKADLEQWQPVLEWLGPAVAPVADPAASAAAAPQATVGTPVSRGATQSSPTAPRRPVAAPPRHHDVPDGVLEAPPSSGLATRLGGLLDSLSLRRRSRPKR
jgi:chromosome partitioning protein